MRDLPHAEFLAQLEETFDACAKTVHYHGSPRHCWCWSLWWVFPGLAPSLRGIYPLVAFAEVCCEDSRSLIRRLHLIVIDLDRSRNVGKNRCTGNFTERICVQNTRNASTPYVCRYVWKSDGMTILMVWAMVACLSAFIWWYNIRIWYLGWMWLSFDGVTYQFGSWIGYSSYLVEWYPDLTSGMKDLRCIVLCKLFCRAKKHIGEFVWWIVWCWRASWGIRLLWICFEKLSQQFRLTAPCCDVCWTLKVGE